MVSALKKLHPGSSDITTRTRTAVPWTTCWRRNSAGREQHSIPHERVRTKLPSGLHEFLALCQVLHAEPYYDVPPGMTPAEMSALMEYMGGPATTPYGAKRAALGQAAPGRACSR